MLFTAFAGLHALNEVLRPFAARKRLKRLETSFGQTMVPLEIGDIVLTKEEILKLSESGALNVLTRGRQRYADMKTCKVIIETEVG